MTLQTKTLALSGGVTYGVVVFVLTLLTTMLGIGAPWITFFLDLPLYSLSIMGSIVGFLYGFIVGYVVLYLLGTLYSFFDS
ncbi:hypothetical protein DID80_01470 [Candidatus Marinamargulisbacteria bacterium SCGC AAA071-K20]|nr:hypothetical protein DID80_01470 [Candidatus Marinamargulisbacteria bacterium SCGC AAA071-K20]